MMSRELGRHRACGKLILMGEHFVVHGAPALALPVTQLHTEAVALHDETLDAPRLISDVPVALRATAEQMLQRALQLLPLDLPLRMEVRSTLPLGCGLGSSASFAAAMVGALAQAVGRRLTLEQHNELAHALEHVVHGTPSGIDNTTITHRRPVWFVRGEPVQLLDGPGTLQLVLASTGQPGSTREAVAGVAALRQAEPARFEALNQRACELVWQGRQAFLEGDGPTLGRLMDENHTLLQQVGVSTRRLDDLARAARAAGALGAKLTGGGRGGFVVALVQDDGSSVERATREAGATQTLRVGA